MPLLTSPSATRREFLITAGATAASLVLGRTAGATQGGPGRPLRLALLSDTHIPADAAERYRGFAPVENLAKVIPQVTAAPVEATLVCGDLARLKGLPEDYARFKTLLAPVSDKMPVAMVLGNHDHRANFLQVLAPPAPAAGGVPNKHTGANDLGGLRFVLLDSLLATDVTPGQLGSAQRDWLSKTLAAATTPTIVVLHHTLGANDGELVDAERLFEVLRPHTHVKAVMFGHSHRYHVRERDGLQLINLPAIGYNFADTEPVGWVESVWTPEGVDLTLHAVGGNMAANGQTTSVHWAR